jgi:hypothetical protein
VFLDFWERAHVVPFVVQDVPMLSVLQEAKDATSEVKDRRKQGKGRIRAGGRTLNELVAASGYTGTKQTITNAVKEASRRGYLRFDEGVYFAGPRPWLSMLTSNAQLANCGFCAGRTHGPLGRWSVAIGSRSSVGRLTSRVDGSRTSDTKWLNENVHSITPRENEHEAG